MWKPSVTPSDVIRHSQGPWKKHKYIEVKDGKYYYPNSYDDGRTISDLKKSQLSDDDIDKIADETMKGKHGNGQERKDKFGDDYARIQNRINEKAGVSKRHKVEDEEDTKEEEKTEEKTEEEKKDSDSKDEKDKDEKKDKKSSSKSSSSKKKKSTKSGSSSKSKKTSASESKKNTAGHQLYEQIKKEMKNKKKSKTAERRRRANVINRKEYLNHADEERIRFSDELMHHGILGMKWGVQNGPPYPLDEKDHSAREKRMARKAARQERAEARKRKKQTKHDIKVQRKAEKEEAKRQKVIKTGDAKQISKYKGRISNEEYDELFKRLANEKHLDELTSSQMKEIASKVNSIKNVVSGIKSTSDAAIDLYNNGASIYNTFLASKGGKYTTKDLITKNPQFSSKDEEKKKKNK